MLRLFRPLVLLTLVMFVAQPFAAQEATRTVVTSGGMAVTIPEDWNAGEAAPQYLDMTDAGSDHGVILAAGEDAGFVVLSLDPNGTAEDAVDQLLNFVNAFGNGGDPAERYTVDSPAGEIVVQPAVLVDGDGILAAVKTADETLVVMLSMRRDGTEFSEEDTDLALDILGSVQFGVDPDSVENTEGSDEETASTSDDVYTPEGAVALEDQPEGKVRFASGAELTLAEGWKLYVDPVSPYVDATATIVNGETIFDSQASLSIVVNEESYYSLQEYRDFLASGVAMIFTGKQDFDPETDIETFELEDGRIVESLVQVEEMEGITDVYIVPLDAQYWAYATLTNANFDPVQTEAIVEAVKEMMLSMVMTEREGAISMEGRQFDVVEADCYTTDYTLSESNPELVVACPAGCGSEYGVVWGTDTYTADSAICPAAIHAGLISADESGLIRVTYAPGLEEYPGTERNGIITEDYGSWGASFTLSLITEETE